MVRQPFDCNALSDCKRPAFKPRATTIKNPQTRRDASDEARTATTDCICPDVGAQELEARTRGVPGRVAARGCWGFCLADALSWCRQY